MATILLSAAGAAIGGSIGGSVLGLSAVSAGRFIGATLGRAIDQRLMGQGSETVETGRIDRFRLTGAGEGTAIARVFGRVRVGGHVIWATEFREESRTEGGGGGKGAPKQPKVTSYSYSVSLALALCEGEITGVHRIWADGAEISTYDLNLHVYTGTRDQSPDPLMEAVEGVGRVPAYRGTAYVVIEDMDLGRFGNRVPQFSFEVTRPDLSADEVPALIEGVALLPGSGEYALAAKPQHLSFGPGAGAAANVNTPSDRADFLTARDQMTDALPNLRAVSLVVSWFGDDLRCDRCTLRPKIEQSRFDAREMPWRVAGLGRGTARVVPELDGGPVYGGTPTDQSVIQAIRSLAEAGQAVLYYPFILMDQLDGNGLADPWTGATDQPPLPWRGRITLSAAPGREGSPDTTAAARDEVAAFFGTARASDFDVSSNRVSYSGPDEWGFRRFILHNAALAAAAGGVEAFCIGSEMRALTQIRDDLGFPAVVELRALLGEVRALLGPDVKLSYAADWSEYFGYHPQDGSGDLYFHLDPLWADPEIDFIGIDNYMPLSDWRDGPDHADAAWGAIYDLDYLDANIEGGEGFDWFYPTPEAVAAQRREPITDGAYGESWVYRYKDIRNWWQNDHHERRGGVRLETSTPWVPQSKPVRFTELGCPAVDKGTNQPNVFLDPKSSENALPRASNGRRDDLIQRQYLRAQHLHWADPANNPVSALYDAPMIDMDHAYVWAWDARPYPWFPANRALWSDAGNYARGHWISGRASARSLASVVAEICARAGLVHVDVSRLFGTVRGFVLSTVTDGRRALQPLMLAYGFDAIERDGVLSFRMRGRARPIPLDPDRLVALDALDAPLVETRAGEAELAGRVRVRFVEADGDHEVVAEEAILPDDATHAVSESEFALGLTRTEGRQIAERFLSESRLARDTLRFALPPSRLEIGAGDVVALPSPGGTTLARIDRIEQTEAQLIDAVRIAEDVYEPARIDDTPPKLAPFVPAIPVLPVFLDLPLLRGDEVPHAPYLAVTSDPWPGSVAVYEAPQDAGYTLSTLISQASAIGVTETDLAAAPSGLIDRGPDLQVRMISGALESIADAGLLAGGNLLAIGDGAPGGWEIVQFRDAQPVAPGTWLLSHRLRGQFGTDGIMPPVWPAGSLVVRLDGTPQQLDLPAVERRQARHYRIGPARRGVDDPVYVHEVHAFDGVGLRPYRPAHLAAVPFGAGLRVSWVRRTRIDGDSWDLDEVPLGETAESYRLEVRAADGSLLRSAAPSAPVWLYNAADLAQDSASGPLTLSVAQVSDRFGPGPAASVALG